MKGIGKWLHLESTRGQIFIGFVVTMIVVMTIMFAIIYSFLSQEKKQSTMLYIEEIAQQAGGRVESLINEINVLTLQMAMDERMQTVLLQEAQGNYASYEDRMKLRKLLLDMTAYSDTIDEVEIYSGERSLYPIVDYGIEARVDDIHIAEADRWDQAGALIWTGKDPWNEQFLLAVRQVKLEKVDYENGGYLVIKVKPSLIELAASNWEKDQGAIMRVVQNDEVLLSTAQIEGQLDDYFLFQKPIKGTGWILQMMVQKKLVLSDIYWLRNMLLIFLSISVLLFAVISYYLAKLISSPMKSLIRVMQGSKHGTPKENPTHYYNKEVNQLNITYNQMVKQIHYLIESVYEKELLKSRSEIRALHSQINPHFLFNTLDAMYWDHIQKGEHKMAHIVVQLADLFRYSIHNRDAEGFVTIKEELEQVERYTNLMKLRWQERLTVHMECEEHLLLEEVPKLIIQPLVENAIVHGIESLAEGGEVKVIISSQSDTMWIHVSDNGIGMKPEQVKELTKNLQQSNEATLQHTRRGIGVYNIHRLLRLHYGEAYGLTFHSKYQQGTTVTLVIPIMDETKEDAT